MGKVILGPSIIDMFNKTGNVVRSHNHYGLYERCRAIPKNPKSYLQRFVRGITSTVSKEWKYGTFNRKDWNDAAGEMLFYKNGKPITLTGEALFMKLNNVLSLLGNSISLTVPAFDDAPLLNNLMLSASVGTPNIVSIVSDIIGNVGNYKAFIQMSPKLSKGTFYGKSYSFTETVTLADGIPSSLLSSYQAKYGALVAGDVGKKIFAKITLMSYTSGQSSKSYNVSCIIS